MSHTYKVKYALENDTIRTIKLDKNYRVFDFIDDIRERFDYVDLNSVYLRKMKLDNDELLENFLNDVNTDVLIVSDDPELYFDHNLIFIGDHGVGKTTIIKKNLPNIPINNQNFTDLPHNYTKRLTINNQQNLLHIWDIKGTEQKINYSFFNDVTICVIVYDITSRSSFSNVDMWLKFIKEKNENVTVFLVGNKNDKENERVISTKEGFEYAKMHNIRFLETNMNKCDNFLNEIFTIDENSEKDKTFLLSSSGLKNIIFDTRKGELISSSEIQKNSNKKLEENEFRFIIGKYEVITNRFLADFISPRVSHLHHSDITVNSIDLNEFIQDEINSNEVFDFELIEIFKKIMIGTQIDINFEIAQKLYYLANLLGNEEISNKMKELFDLNLEQKNADDCLSYLKIRSNLINQKDIVDLVSSKFYLFDHSKLLKLPKSTLFLILSNENLTLNSEDSLFEFIKKIFSPSENENFYHEDDEYINEAMFYELIDFTALSNDKIYEFIESFDTNNITRNLWQKFTKCFDTIRNENLNTKSTKRYLK